MAYEKQNFVNGQTLTADHLNHMEEGIVALEAACPPSGASSNQCLVTDGEGNTKWEDKLCWSETVEHLKESDAVEREDSYFGKTWLIENAPELEIGKTYTVKYNGVDYSCVCQKAPSHVTDDDNAVAMGNFSAAGGDDTGEPFAMMISPEFNSVNVIDLSGASSVKVGIVEEVVHTINKKYLPTSGICLRFSPHEEGRGEYIGEYAPAEVLKMIREDITIPIVFAMPTMDYDYYYKPISFLDRGPNSYITADFIGKGGSNMTMKIGSDEICLYFV